MPAPELDELCINTIRFLAVDAVQKANSGHPGTPMGAATMAYVLWDRFLKHNPEDPAWPDRDRFILSPGHASAMLYGTGSEVHIALETGKQLHENRASPPVSCHCPPGSCSMLSLRSTAMPFFLPPYG